MKLNINKKRILFIFICVCFSIIGYGIMYNINLKNKDIKANATPITNKTIIIDAGHGIPDEG